jgi:hypothetical protein
MIPTNKDNDAGCVPVSSNCVIWQGPDIPCIQLCKGDNISDVTARLAKELCTIMDYLKIDTYNLECFNPVCPTLENFHDLIQFIITKLCELQTCCEQQGGSQVVLRTTEKVLTNQTQIAVAPCFQFVNETGDTVTTMTLEDYARAIGSRVCSLILDIAAIDRRVTSLETRVTNIENNCCDDTPVEYPMISSCVLGPNPGGWPFLTVLQALETQFCELKAATGTPNALYLAIAKQCANLDIQQSLAMPGTNMGSLPGWVPQANYVNLADSINNMWITICDLRAAVLSLADCCQPGCRDIEITMYAAINGANLEIYITGIIPTGWNDCSGLGSQVTITDTDGNTYVTNIQLPANINQPPTLITLASTPLNPILDFTITMNACLINNTARVTCERVISFLLDNSITCPAMTITATGTSIDYSFANGYTPPVTYTIELLNSLGTIVLDTITHVNPAVGPVASTFIGLSASTTYNIRVTVDYNGNTKICPLTAVTTDPDPCEKADLFNVIPAF